MDWLPTLLSAAGGRPDPAYPSDGIDLLPMLTGAAPVRPRTLFWRFKGNAQRAVRDGNMKYLKMLDNTFLFDVVADPMERADLKQRRPEVFQQLVTRWLEWNATMLPEVDESQTGGNDGATWADHVGSPLPTRKADNPPAPAR
jgi:arylsulfatase A-like enzyme